MNEKCKTCGVAFRAHKDRNGNFLPCKTMNETCSCGLSLSSHYDEGEWVPCYYFTAPGDVGFLMAPMSDTQERAAMHIIDPMKERQDRIWNELMKLPRSMLEGMYQATTDYECTIPNGGNITSCSKDDLARALTPFLAKRDFMR